MKKKEIEKAKERIEKFYCERVSFGENSKHIQDTNKENWARRVEMKLNLILDILKEQK